MLGALVSELSGTQQSHLSVLHLSHWNSSVKGVLVVIVRMCPQMQRRLFFPISNVIHSTSFKLMCDVDITTLVFQSAAHLCQFMLEVMFVYMHVMVCNSYFACIISFME